MKNYIRITAFAMLLVLIVPLCMSCADSKTEETQPEVTTVQVLSEETTQDPTKDENGYEKDTLPDDLSFDGQTVSILYWKDVENQEYFAEEQTGAEVNDAIFRRNAAVSDRLKVEFSFTPIDGDSGNAKNYLAYMQANVKSGSDDAYDIISAHSRTIGLCAYNGLTKDLKNMEYFNWEKPWWQDSLLNTATINNQLHFVSGDISTNLLYMMYVVFYNKDFIKNYPDLSDPYEYVANGTWTLDKMISVSSNLYQDLDTIPGKSAGDQFGQAARYLHIDAYLWGSDIICISNTDGTLALSESFLGDKTANLIEKLNSYLVVSEDNIFDPDGGSVAIFQEGRCYFTTDRADVAINDLDEKDFDLGILPIPKYNEDQENYLTVAGNPFSLYAVPVNAESDSLSSAVLECMASESYRTVTPVIFEISMKTRYASGSNDAICYDIVREGVVYDLSRIMWKVLSDYSTAPDTLYQNQVKVGTSTWASNLKTNKKTLEKAIKSINTAFSK